MRERALSLIVDSLGKVAQPHTSAHFCDIIGVEGGCLKALQVDDHTSTLSAQAERGIAMATTPWLDLYIVLCSTSHGI